MNMKAEQKMLSSAMRTGLALVVGVSFWGVSAVATADCSSSNGCADTYRGAIADAQNGYLGYFNNLQLGQSLGGMKFSERPHDVSDASRVGNTVNFLGQSIPVNGPSNVYTPGGNDTGPSESHGVNYN
jgi:hypothetical protein